MNIKGQVAVVTGGSGDIGKAISLALAKQGCKIVVCYRSHPGEAQEVVEEIEKEGGEAITAGGDLCEDEDCIAIMNRAMEHFSGLHILVNNAGRAKAIPHKNLADVSKKIWMDTLAINLMGPFQCIRAAHPHMLKSKGGGHVINIASIAGIYAKGTSVPYAAAKAGLINMGTSLARALGPDIRINTVAPGFVESSLTRGNFQSERDYDEQVKRIEGIAVLDKVCAPVDIADTVVSLATGSPLVTAQTIICDAGFTIGPRL